MTRYYLLWAWLDWFWMTEFYVVHVCWWLFTIILIFSSFLFHPFIVSDTSIDGVGYPVVNFLFFPPSCPCPGPLDGQVCFLFTSWWKIFLAYELRCVILTLESRSVFFKFQLFDAVYFTPYDKNWAIYSTYIFFLALDQPCSYSILVIYPRLYPICISIWLTTYLYHRL